MHLTNREEREKKRERKRWQILKTQNVGTKKLIYITIIYFNWS